jgi:hypothetical protein
MNLSDNSQKSVSKRVCVFVGRPEFHSQQWQYSSRCRHIEGRPAAYAVGRRTGGAVRRGKHQTVKLSTASM